MRVRDGPVSAILPCLFYKRKEAERIDEGGELGKKEHYVQNKGLNIHGEPKGESHSFYMSPVPLLHIWEDRIIS